MKLWPYMQNFSTIRISEHTFEKRYFYSHLILSHFRHVGGFPDVVKYNVFEDHNAAIL